MTDEQKNKLLQAGFDLNQINEIRQGKEDGVDISLYARKEFLAIHMREIRLGLMDGIDVRRYANSAYDWFQMQEIREGLKSGVNVDAYCDPSISYDRMRQVRLGLEQGVNLSKYVRLEAGLLEQLRKAYVSKVNILEYIKEGYDPEQLEEIRIAIEKGLDLKPYLSTQFRGMAVRQIREGLEDGIDVSVYAKLEYDWRQMQEIRLGLENRVDISWYSNSMYSFRQMYEIRRGLEKGLDVSAYKSLMYTAQEMHKRRRQIEKTGAVQGRALPQGTAEQVKRTVFPDFAISISEDEMQAFIVVKKAGLPLKRTEMQQALREHGVTRGIDHDMMNVLERGATLEQVVKIAEGQKPKDGDDGWYEFFFRTDMARAPKLLHDGPVDYRSAEWYEVVKKGQKLALYHDATDGTGGYSVKGRAIQGKKGIEKKILTGDGFHVLEDGKTYISDIDGRIDLQDERMQISRMLIMKGVSISSGNVNFEGTVHVLGDVSNGARIEATDHVIVDGFVEAAIIECGGDVVLRKGMNAKGSNAKGMGGYIHAKNVLGSFFEATKIQTLEDIRAGYCMNCDLYAEGEIVITGANGSLMGGMSCAVGGICVDNLGNPAGIATKIRLGVSDSITMQQKNVQASINSVKQELKILKNGHSEITAKYSAEERNGMEVFLKIENAIYTKEMELEKLNTEKLELEERVKQLKRVSVLVSNMLYEGVDIEVNGTHWHSHEMNNVTIRSINGRMIVNTNR